MILKINVSKDLFDFLKNNKSIGSIDLITKHKGFYIEVTSGAEVVEVPYNYILTNSNSKIDNTAIINFEVNCSSKKLGFCTNKKYCYSQRDQKRFKANNYKIILNVALIKAIQKDNKEFLKVVDYLKNFDLIRFNCNNDLNNINNLKFLIELAEKLPNIKIGGYTNRYDLIKDQQHLKSFNTPNNLIINGSNYLLDNNFYCTINLKKYCNTNYYCLGSCKNCLKCYNKSNKTIYCLLHGALNTIDTAFNTADNRKYLIQFFNNNFNNLNIEEQHLLKYKGLLKSLNTYFKQHKIYNEYHFKNYKELTTFIKVFNRSD